MESGQFEYAFNRAFEGISDYSFPSKIAGMTHENGNFTSRQELIRGCQFLELLELVPEPDNPVDVKAVGVWRRSTNKQLGYLPARTAHDLLAQMKEPGTKWFAVFGFLYRVDNRIVGAGIRVVCTAPEKFNRLLERNAERSKSPGVPYDPVAAKLARWSDAPDGLDVLEAQRAAAASRDNGSSNRKLWFFCLVVLGLLLIWMSVAR